MSSYFAVSAVIVSRVGKIIHCLLLRASCSFQTPIISLANSLSSLSIVIMPHAKLNVNHLSLGWKHVMLTMPIWFTFLLSSSRKSEFKVIPTYQSAPSFLLINDVMLMLVYQVLEGGQVFACYKPWLTVTFPPLGDRLSLSVMVGFAHQQHVTLVEQRV